MHINEYLLKSVLGTLQELPHLILTTFLQGQYCYYSQVRGEEIGPGRLSDLPADTQIFSSLSPACTPSCPPARPWSKCRLLCRLDVWAGERVWECRGWGGRGHRCSRQDVSISALFTWCGSRCPCPLPQPRVPFSTLVSWWHPSPQRLSVGITSPYRRPWLLWLRQLQHLPSLVLSSLGVRVYPSHLCHPGAWDGPGQDINSHDNSCPLVGTGPMAKHARGWSPHDLTESCLSIHARWEGS